MAEFNNRIYASTVSYTDTHGTEIWRSSSGDSGSWSQVVNDGFDGDSDNAIAVSLEVFNGYMYAGTDNRNSGTEVWSTPDGTNWSKVNTDGFGDQYNWSVTLEEFNGYLYAGTYN
jgi:flagellin